MASSAKIADRMAKLRRMAEHPASNPHEAAVARAELERLTKHGHAEGYAPSWINVGLSRDIDEFATRYYEMIVQEAECWVCGVKIDPGWAERVSISKCPVHVDILISGNAGYYDWARSLSVGDRVNALNTRENPGARTPRPLVIQRMTATQYVMDDGSRYRRAGQFPGYKVGEDGRDGGRTYMVRMP